MTNVQYVIVCPTILSDTTDTCQPTHTFMIKKLAAFEVFTPVYNCETATIETQTLATPTAYNVQYTLPNPQAVLEFSIHKDSVGVASGDPIKCG